MTLITVENGKVVLRSGKVGTEQACCCEQCAPCPDLESLCIDITLTDYDGTVHTADETDIIWSGGTGTIYFKGFEYVVTIACDTSNPAESLSAIVGWGGLIDDCICTSGSGSDAMPCSTDQDWYLGTLSGSIVFDDIGVPCAGGCPANLGSFSVTFADPPC